MPVGPWDWAEAEVRLMRQAIRMLEEHDAEVRERVLDNLQKWHLRKKMRESQSKVAS